MALTKDQQNVIAGTIGVTLFVVMVMWKAYFPMAETFKRKQTELDGINQQIAQMKIKAQQRDKLRMEMEMLRIEVQESQKQLPETAKMDDLLRLITDVAIKTGIKIQQFNPGKKVSKEIYTEIPITMQINTGYHNFANFLVELTQKERIISAQNVAITGGGAQSDFTINSNFTLMTYMSK